MHILTKMLEKAQAELAWIADEASIKRDYTKDDARELMRFTEMDGNYVTLPCDTILGDDEVPAWYHTCGRIDALTLVLKRLV